MKCRHPLVVCLLLLGACEDPPPTATAPSAKPVPQLAPPPQATSTAPAEEAKAVRPKKTAEDCAKGPEVSFDDPKFEDEVRRKLPKEKGAITIADLARLRSLNVASIKFEQLDPCLFPHMTGLKELFLGPGEYDDLSPLAGLTKLESLRASISKVSDIKPLAEMKKMDRLDLGRTSVEDLSAISEMSALTELQLDDTPVADLSPLAKLSKLERLSIQRTKVKDVTALKGMKNLKFLYVAGTPLDDDPMLLAPVRANGVKIMAQ